MPGQILVCTACCFNVYVDVSGTMNEKVYNSLDKIRVELRADRYIKVEGCDDRHTSKNRLAHIVSEPDYCYLATFHLAHFGR